MKNLHLAVALFALCAALFTAARPASGQVLRGSVVDARTGLPIPAALLTVRDSERVIRARMLTDASGRFDLGLGAMPSSLTVEFVGYAPQTLNVTQRDQHFDVKLQPAPVALKGIVAERKRECRKSDDPKIVSVWYAARAALGATRVENSRRFRTREFIQAYNQNFEHEGVDSMQFSTVTGTDAYKAASPDSLRDFGYVRNEQGLRLFFGPDAELLLSDDFVDTHCFGITRDAQHEGLVGLTFWPKDGRKKTDIRGTMWVGEQAADLKYVEYTFTGLSDTLDDKLFSGKVEFDKLSDGTWVVRRWHIRLPRFGNFALGRRGKTLVIGVTDGGGEFLGFDRRSLPADEIGTVRGTVFDSSAMRPLANAPVHLLGTTYETMTDSLGRFVMPNVGTGVHYVVFYDPRMSLLPLGRRAVRINVERGATTNAQLALPRAESLLRMVCPAEKLQKAAAVVKYSGPVGAIAGVVTNPRGLPIGNAIVDAEWGLSELPKTVVINKNIRSLNTTTDPSGHYIICGVPAPLPLVVRVRMGDAIVAEQSLRLEGLVQPLNIVVDGPGVNR